MSSHSDDGGETPTIDARLDQVEEISSGHELYQDDVNLTVEFEHLSEPQAITLMAMFQRWESNGSIGASRWVEFFVDGDGPFHPSINFETEGSQIDETDPEFKMLRDEAEIEHNRYDAGAVIGWFIDQALDAKEDQEDDDE